MAMTTTAMVLCLSLVLVLGFDDHSYCPHYCECGNERAQCQALCDMTLLPVVREIWIYGSICPTLRRFLEGVEKVSFVLVNEHCGDIPFCRSV